VFHVICPLQTQSCCQKAPAKDSTEKSGEISNDGHEFHLPNCLRGRNTLWAPFIHPERHLYPLPEKEVAIDKNRKSPV